MDITPPVELDVEQQKPRTITTRTKLLLAGLGAAGALFAWSRTKAGEATIQSGLDTMFLKPIDGRITSPYGMRSDPITGQRSGHNGIDFGVAIGTPIKAPFDGVVAFSFFVDPNTVYPSPNAVGMARWLDASGKIPANATQAWWDAASGNAVGIRTPDGKYEMSFGHMSRRDVAKGDVVKAGQVIGLTGNTGYTTGPHAHVVMRLNGREVDPMSIPEFKALFA